MKQVLDFEPKRVFYHFEELTKIPRGSGNERQVSDYLVTFAKEHGLDYVQDEFMNVIIRKSATTGYEHLPGVILQGHMDMVNEKNGDKVHDFDKDPLSLIVKEDYIYADGTTLGADNGIAVAMALTILESKDIPHPPLEALFTVEEETGLTGAAKLDGKHLHGKFLINIDSEEEGKFLVSCAGGARTKLNLPITLTSPTKPAAYLLEIKGLQGGHSGIDSIKGRGNSNKILGRILYSLGKELNYELAHVSGGSKMNAIPREATALILTSEEESLQQFVSHWNTILVNELFGRDEGIKLSYTKTDAPKEVFTEDSKTRMLSALMTIPNGIKTMSSAIENLVESSVNLGVLTTENGKVVLESCHRSSVGSLLNNLLDVHQSLANSLGGELIIDSRYPEWQYKPDSKLREHFKKVYQDFTGEEAETVAIHAGVECGLLGEKVADMDMISLGPNMHDVHTPNEHLSISSTKKVYEFLLEALKQFQSI